MAVLASIIGAVMESLANPLVLLVGLTIGFSAQSDREAVLLGLIVAPALGTFALVVQQEGASLAVWAGTAVGSLIAISAARGLVLLYRWSSGGPSQ
jgi:hypothetical protein